MSKPFVIWKFPLQVADKQVVMMPYGAAILSVGVQGNDIILWALVNAVNQKEKRNITVAMTGHQTHLLPGNANRQFIGTVQIEGFVFHAFDEGV